AISDSHEGAKPDASIMTYLSRNLELGLIQYDTLTYEGKTDDIRNNVMMVFPNSASVSGPGKVKQTGEAAIRSFFDQTGVLVSRPIPGSPCNIGVAFKGGNNAESHNHNDVGSFTIVQGTEIMVGDPGAIAYTANIFTPEYRYTYKTVGSFGHPVPLVAGIGQQPGAQARSKTVRTDFTREKDDITFDIASAYNVPELKKLERTMDYNRTAAGSVTFTDRFEYTQPEAFEIAIPTRSRWKQTSDSTLLLIRGKEKMLVTFSSPGNNLSLRSEQISEGGTPYSRIGIFTGKPVKSGQISITYMPVN
ncbi:heparinase II/III domain-containing protein, partial [Chitinophaga sp.]|uniref:heparinase II/III domain-containing protein n=1 Tax=Chitinophaga sp. TaxID=1869181 RepID=UPI002CAD6D2C